MSDLLLQQREILSEADKTKKSSLSSQLYHIRDMIQKIKMGFGDLTEEILDHPKTPETIKISKYLAINHAESFNLLSTILEIIHETPNNETFNLRSMLNNIAFLLFPHQKSQKTEFQIIDDKKLPSCCVGNKSKFYLILLNLMLNATLMTFHGKIKLQIKKQSHQEIKIQIECTGYELNQNYFKEESNNFKRDFTTGGLGRRSFSNLPLVREYLSDLSGSLLIQHYKQKNKNGLKFVCHLPIQFQSTGKTRR